MNKIKCLVIDDEFFNRGLITMLISKLNSGFIISGEAESVNEGYKMIHEVRPDVVFLDIKMPDGSGFDLLKRFTSIDFEVVFITGFDQYALEAFEHNALDYVLKPIDLDKFSNTLQRVQNRIHKSIPNLDLIRSSTSTGLNAAFITKIPIHNKEGVILLPVNEIQYAQSQGDLTFFFREENESYSSSKLLEDFEFILNSLPNFFRIDQTTYINLNFIASYSKGTECSITLKNGAILEVSQKIMAEIMDLIGVAKEN